MYNYMYDAVLPCSTAQLGSLNCEVPAKAKSLGSLTGVARISGALLLPLHYQG